MRLGRSPLYRVTSPQDSIKHVRVFHCCPLLSPGASSSQSLSRGIDTLFNTGPHRATRCGLEHARGKWVVIVDDDFQHSPEAIPLLVDRIRQQPSVDCVLAKFEVKHHSWVRNLGSRFASRLFTHLYGKPKGIAASSFRILSRELVDASGEYRMVTPLVGTLNSLSTQPTANVTIPPQPRQAIRAGDKL